MNFRTKLTLINGVFVFVLLVLGSTVLMVRTRQVFRDSIDRDLLQFAGNVARAGGGPGPGPGSGPMGFGGGRFQPDGAPGAEPPENQDRPTPPRPRFLARNDLRRPVVFDPEGRPRDPTETRILDSSAFQKVRQNQPLLTLATYEESPVRVVTVPIFRDLPDDEDPNPVQVGFVQLGHSLADFERLKSNQWQTMALMLPIFLVTTFAVSWLLTWLVLGPIRKMSATASLITSEDLSQRLDVQSQDELGQLSLTFNQMLDRLQVSFMAQRELLERQKQFIADASHELRTPITRIQLTASSALELDSSEEDWRESLTIVERESKRMGKLADQLLELARLENPDLTHFETLDLGEVVQSVLESDPRYRNITYTGQAGCRMSGDIFELDRLLTNLIENAIRHTSTYGTDPTSIQVIVEPLPDAVRLVVKDHGEGIPQEHLELLTHRFFRADAARNSKHGGTGLGLAIVKAIVDRHQGKISIRSQVGQGTEIDLVFPAKS